MDEDLMMAHLHMLRRLSSRWPVLFAPVLAACSASGAQGTLPTATLAQATAHYTATAVPGDTALPTPTPLPVAPTPTPGPAPAYTSALAWVQRSAQGKPQIWA